jgi:nucleobase:cation symporter-1, NCS1 family
MTQSHAVEATSFDAHGIEPVPESDRTSSALDQFWIWMGANIAPINWVLGTLGITLGLSLVETVAVVAAGNALGCAVFGLFCVMGHRTGVNMMVLSRAAFGRRGAYLPAAVQFLLTMGWIGVNTWIVLDLAMAALGQIGITGGQELRYIVAFAVMLAQCLIAVWGFYAIRSFERWTVPITALIVVVMSVLAVTQADVSFAAGKATGTAKLTAITQLMTAIGVGWGMSWLVYAADYSRFTRPRIRDRKVFWMTGLGMYVPTVWLAALGAVVASGGGGSDPSDVVISTFGAMALPVLLLVLHGPIATNVLNFYSCGLAALSFGLRVARWKISLAAGLLASAVLVAFIEAGDFANSFDSWMVSLIVWIAPWAAIVAVEFFVVRRGRVDVGALYGRECRSRYGDVNWRALVALAAGVVAGWAWEFGLVGAFQGPLAKTFSNTDLSWLTGALVAGGAYYLLVGHAERRVPAPAQAEPAAVPAPVP